MTAVDGGDSPAGAAPRVVRRRELPDGLALQLPIDALPAVARFIDRERRCCPFLRFDLEVKPAGGSLRLRLTATAHHGDTESTETARTAGGVSSRF